nr:MAG TPA: Mga helix-turn-helix domain [Caudoviricetes sp.]
MPNYTDNLRLEKPLQSENYNIDIFNSNADKIDTAIQEVKGKVDGLELTAQRVSIADSTNKFEATNVEDALLENKTSILELQKELGTNKTTLQNNINAIREVL